MYCLPATLCDTSVIGADCSASRFLIGEGGDIRIRISVGLIEIQSSLLYFFLEQTRWALHPGRNQPVDEFSGA